MLNSLWADTSGQIGKLQQVFISSAFFGTDLGKTLASMFCFIQTVIIETEHFFADNLQKFNKLDDRRDSVILHCVVLAQTFPVLSLPHTYL